MSTPAAQLDLSNIAESPQTVRRAPLRRAAPAGAYDSSDAGDWSLERDAPKVKDWFKQTFGSDLPVSAYGQSRTHNRMGFDHSNAMDVPLSPVTKEGAALVSYLRENRIPFRAFDRAVAGAATGPHIHVGFGSHSAGEAPRLNLEDISDSAPALDLSDLAEPADDGVVRIESAINRDGSPRPLMLPPAPKAQPFPPPPPAQ